MSLAVKESEETETGFEQKVHFRIIQPYQTRGHNSDIIKVLKKFMPFDYRIKKSTGYK